MRSNQEARKGEQKKPGTEDGDNWQKQWRKLLVSNGVNKKGKWLGKTSGENI